MEDAQVVHCYMQRVYPLAALFGVFVRGMLSLQVWIDEFTSIQISNSTERPAKLLTKFRGFLISCAMPAVSCPSAANSITW